LEISDNLRKAGRKKRGNSFGFRLFDISLRIFGLRGAYGLLSMVCVYYVLFDRSAVSAALAYINRRFSVCGFWQRHLHVYRLFVNQGKQLIDRYTVILGHRIFDIQIKGRKPFLNLVQASGQGVILLTSHVGNWQIAMTALKDLDRTVYLLMRPEDNLAVHNSLGVSIEQGNIKIISPEQYLGGIVEIMDVLKKGHIVSIMGDRSYGSNTLDVSFIGATAWFPYSAFAIAAAARCPVVFLTSTKVSAYKYAIDMSNVLYPHYEGRQDKREQLRQWVQEFAALIETFVDQHPYQCFLFHDVWNEELNNADK